MTVCAARVAQQIRTARTAARSANRVGESFTPQDYHKTRPPKQSVTPGHTKFSLSLQQLTHKEGPQPHPGGVFSGRSPPPECPARDWFFDILKSRAAKNAALVSIILRCATPTAELRPHRSHPCGRRCGSRTGSRPPKKHVSAIRTQEVIENKRSSQRRPLQKPARTRRKPGISSHFRGRNRHFPCSCPRQQAGRHAD